MGRGGRAYDDNGGYDNLQVLLSTLKLTFAPLRLYISLRLVYGKRSGLQHFLLVLICILGCRILMDIIE